VSYVASKQSKQGSFPVWSDVFDVSLRPWQDVTVQYVVPGALHATFYDLASTPIHSARHVPFSATVPGAIQVRYRGLLKFPYAGTWLIHFKDCIFSFGVARFQGANILASNVSGSNTTISVSIADPIQFHDFVFQCSNFLVNKSSVTFSLSQLSFPAVFQPVIYSGFGVFSKTFLGQGLWATYYGSDSLPQVAVSNQVPSLMLNRPEIAASVYSSIRWSGFIQVNLSKLYTFGIRHLSSTAAYLKIDDRVSSTNYVPGTINLLLMTMFLRSGELHDIDISITFGSSAWRCSEMRDLFGLLWIERVQPEASLTEQLVTFPTQNLFSALSSSSVDQNDSLQFPWRSPLETRIVSGAAMARGMGYNRQNTPLRVIVNAGSVCAATSSFVSSASLSIFTAGVASSFVFVPRDQFANEVETAPIMTFWGMHSSRGSTLFGTITPAYEDDSSSYPSQMQPPVMNGLFAHYSANSYNSEAKVWNDLSGLGNHVTEIGGVITVARPTGSAAYIQGDTSAWMQFPTTVLPSTYTLFHVARYNGLMKKRIFQGLSTNWLSGFWSGIAGVAFHGCFITPIEDYPGTDWIVASDRTNSFRSNGVERKTANSCVSGVRMSINRGPFNENSDFAIQIILVYNRRLSDSEVFAVENWLSQYCIISTQETTSNVQMPLSRSQVKVAFLPTLSGTIFSFFNRYVCFCCLSLTRWSRRISHRCTHRRWFCRCECTRVACSRSSH
jgi:hypothetical protein